MLESKFVKDTVRPDLLREFPGIVIIKQEPLTSFQGVPDYILLFRSTWAALETKRAKKAAQQPNQDYYREQFNGMSYAAFAHPGNWDQVLEDLRKVFA